jgi:ribosomal protein S18 acetylase RimI-like enzyme
MATEAARPNLVAGRVVRWLALALGCQKLASVSVCGRRSRAKAQVRAMKPIPIRHAEPSDYEPIISIVNDWWGGRNMCDMLPKLFFVHFRQTSFVAEDNGNLVGFLTGFISQTFPEEAYIHFAGVHPEFRRRSVGRALYERFFFRCNPPRM